MPTLYNPFRKKGVFMIPAGGLGPSVSAAFSYAKSSYHQDETDPTPTITGTTGGTFSATPSGLSINASTGTIDLSASTIQSYTITYTVSGVSANFSLGVTASPFIANTYSFLFDGVNDYVSVDENGSFPFGLMDTGVSSTVSLWANFATLSQSGNAVLFEQKGFSQRYVIWFNDSDDTINFYPNSTKQSYTVNANQWYHIVATLDGTTARFYINSIEIGAGLTYTSTNTNTILRIGANPSNTQYFNGKIDEVAIWNTALGETAIQEIYNATNNNTGKALDLSTDYNNYTSSSNLQYWNRLGD